MNSKSIESAYKPRFSFSPLAYERNSIMAQCKSVHSTMRKKRMGKTDKTGRKALDHKRGARAFSNCKLKTRRIRSHVFCSAFRYGNELQSKISIKPLLLLQLIFLSGEALSARKAKSILSALLPFNAGKKGF